MKATTKTYWYLEHGSGYWMQESIRQVLNSIGGDPYSDDIEFSSRETGREFATAVLRRYIDLLNAEDIRANFYDKGDTKKAMGEVGINDHTYRQDYRLEGRFIGEPEIRIGERGQTILHREVEVRVSRGVEVVKTVTVDGEEFTRKTIETAYSSWYPAFPEQVSISIYDGTRVEVA